MLFNKLTEIFPKQEFNSTRKLESIIRFLTYLTVICFLITNRIQILFVGILTICIVYISYKLFKIKNKESFRSSINPKVLPAPTNPLMNVLLTDYKDNPTRKEASRSWKPKVEEKINYNDSMFVVENPENPDSPKSQKPISLLPEHKPETKYTYLKPEPDTISTISTNSGYGPGPETGHKPTRYTNKRTPLLIYNFTTNITAGGNYDKSKLKQTLKKNKKYIKK